MKVIKEYMDNRNVCVAELARLTIGHKSAYRVNTPEGEIYFGFMPLKEVKARIKCHVLKQCDWQGYGCKCFCHK